jgi:hypothetical protein
MPSGGVDPPRDGTRDGTGRQPARTYPAVSQVTVQ